MLANFIGKMHRLIGLAKGLPRPCRLGYILLFIKIDIIAWHHALLPRCGAFE